MNAPPKFYDKLEIESLQGGGFIVREGYMQAGEWRAELVAFSSLKEMTTWINEHMKIY